MRTDGPAALAPGAIERVLTTDNVTPATRAALRDRLNETPSGGPQSLDRMGYATLIAVCDRLIPQSDTPQRVDIAARLDARLASGGGDGWRYDVLPPDQIATGLGVRGIDQTARALFQAPFVTLNDGQQDQVLHAVQDGDPPGDLWRTLNASLFFVDLLAVVTELFYAHPYAQERIGYIGMADAHGFHALGLNRRDPVEEQAYRLPGAHAAV